MTDVKYPPGPSPILSGRHLFAFMRDPLKYLLRMRDDYGDIAHLQRGSLHIFYLNHPDYVRDVLVTNADKFIKGPVLQRTKFLLGEGLLTSENPVHRRQRRLAQPAFHRQRINDYAKVMVECAARLSERWQTGAHLDASLEMNHLTLRIVGKTLFNSDVEREADEVGAALTQTMKMFPLLQLPYFELLRNLPLPQMRRVGRAREQLDKVIYRIIEEHRQAAHDQGDLLSMLLAASDEEDATAGGMSDEQVRDEAMTIFLAGHETTANWLAWTWHLLGTHPEVERKLHAELDGVLEGRRLPNAEDYARLTYTEQVLTEVLRVRPPAWALGRTARENHNVGGYEIPHGSLVIVSPFVMHHDARYFPEPERFDPKRWTTIERERRPQFSFFPFGGGARRCIGEGFAWMEAVLVLAALASRWKLKPASDKTIEMQPRVTLRPNRGVPIVLESRV